MYRPRCFVVVQRYLTELNYYYLQSDSEDTIRVSKLPLNLSYNIIIVRGAFNGDSFF